MYKVLYVQSNEDIARLFMDEFLASEYQLLIAHTGEEALSIIHETDVLLLLIDINVPDMRIRRLIQRAKEISPGIIVNVCIDVCDYKLITKLVNRFGVHKIYVAPWNIDEIIYEIGDSIEVALINEEAQVRESNLVRERESLDETIVNLRNALTKQQYSYEKIKKLTDCFMEGVRDLGNNGVSKSNDAFVLEAFDKYLLLTTTGRFSIEELESGIKSDLDELISRFPDLDYMSIMSCFFGGVGRIDAVNCRYAVWLITRLYVELYKQVSVDVKSKFITTTQVKVSCIITALNKIPHDELKEDERAITGFVNDVLNIIVRGIESGNTNDTMFIYEFNVRVKDD